MGYSFVKIITLLTYICPKNLSVLWTYGSLLGLVLVLQLCTGLFLTMHYTASMELAFDSIIYINRDVNGGWLIRNMHATGAAMFFLFIYTHIARGVYYSSNKMTMVWLSGVTLFLLSMMAAFLGYVLPWGQMSYWAATVITNLLSAIPYLGLPLVYWVWGGFSVGKATLMRFYTLHFLIPMLLCVLSLVHIYLLHAKGSSNPLGRSSSVKKIMFHPYLTWKDIMSLLFWLSCLSYILFFSPFCLSDADNYIEANPLVTPNHIQPEWYFLPMYAILRSIPSKLGGVVALVLSLCILYLMPLNGVNRYQFCFWKKLLVLIFMFSFLGLMWIGSKVVEHPYESIGIVLTFLYFFTFLCTFWDCW